jgi:hypothetical protein
MRNVCLRTRVTATTTTSATGALATAQKHGRQLEGLTRDSSAFTNKGQSRRCLGLGWECCVRTKAAASAGAHAHRAGNPDRPARRPARSPRRQCGRPLRRGARIALEECARRATGAGRPHRAVVLARTSKHPLPLPRKSRARTGRSQRRGGRRRSGLRSWRRAGQLPRCWRSPPFLAGQASFGQLSLPERER